MMHDKSIVFMANSPEHPVNALLLTRKFLATAQHLGYQATLVDAAQTPVDADYLIVIGRQPTQLTCPTTPKIAVIAIDPIPHDIEQSLQQALQQANAQQRDANTLHKPPTATRFVAITACPTGVAHTFMAAEALQSTATKLGFQIEVETQGSVGAKNILTDAAIANAEVVILATDIEVNTDRFIGKRVYRCGTGYALKQTTACFDAAIAQGKVLESSHSKSSTTTESKEKTGIYKHLLTGVSFMLPMVVAGGLLIALSFCFGITAFEVEGSLAAVLMQIGKAAFTLMVPMLAGYIAYSIADRPGLAPGLIGGVLATQMNAGFLGGIVAGFLAGYVALFLAKKLKLPTSLEALKPILLIPLCASLVVGLIMIYVVGQPVASIFAAMTDYLQHMGTANAIILGIILSAMMCIDLGGPINKAAYAFTVGLLTTNQYIMPMAATMAGGMVPPLGMAIATFIAAKKFERAERDAGKATFVLGLCFISEGAIPFAAKDPMRVIPCSIVGGMITGGLVAFFECALRVPHGGIMVLLIPNAVNHALWYLLAITVGSLVTGISYAMIKKPLSSSADPATSISSN